MEAVSSNGVYRKTVVASQPFFFPWVGFLEQIQLADVFILVDDFQFVRSGFIHRVQVKVSSGTHWLTIPVRDRTARKPICDVLIDESTPWRKKYIDTLAMSYAGAAYRDDMLELVSRVFALSTDSLTTLVRASMTELFRFFDLHIGREFLDNAVLGISGAKSARVLGLVQAVGGDRYITGHGAANYLDHELLERNGICVEYMNYQLRPYSQLHGTFTPYVSSLDLVANLGRRGRDLICSGTKAWRHFLHDRTG